MSTPPLTPSSLEASLSSISERCAELREALRSVLTGSEELIEGLLLCLVAGGHGLIEGPPGVGKTLAIKALSATLGLRLTRVQMTPDLMPSDLIGGAVLTQGSTAEGVPTTPALKFHEGPLFTELLFADELNRANPRTQAALLEAMAERQVSVEGQTRPLGPPFYVFATQNPVELEGTFTLPAAQADRFLCRLLVRLPSAETLSQLLLYDPSEALSALSPLVERATLQEWPQASAQVVIPERLLARVVQLVVSTRPRHAPEGVAHQLSAGVSPRAAQDLASAVRARAAIAGRPFARDEDLERVAPMVLAHRVSLSWEARAVEGASESIIRVLLNQSSRAPR